MLLEAHFHSILALPSPPILPLIDLYHSYSLLLHRCQNNDQLYGWLEEKEMAVTSK